MVTSYHSAPVCRIDHFSMLSAKCRDGSKTAYVGGVEAPAGNNYLLLVIIILSFAFFINVLNLVLKISIKNYSIGL